jgi:hypothetical protein
LKFDTRAFSSFGDSGISIGDFVVLFMDRSGNLKSHHPIFLLISVKQTKYVAIKTLTATTE